MKWILYSAVDTVYRVTSKAVCLCPSYLLPSFLAYFPWATEDVEEDGLIALSSESKIICCWSSLEQFFEVRTSEESDKSLNKIKRLIKKEPKHTRARVPLPLKIRYSITLHKKVNRKIKETLCFYGWRINLWKNTTSKTGSSNLIKNTISFCNLRWR